MIQRLMLALAVALMLVSSAAAQYIVVGPPDDLTYIDTTDQSAWFMKPPPLMTSLGAKTSLPVDTINITQLDCSLFPLICTYFEALDSLGNPIGGLTADSFCVYQDGILIGPGNFTFQELSVDSCITSICLVVDVSGSMTEGTKFTDTKNAMRRFVRNMDSYDRVAIVSFASTVTTVQTFTSDTTLLLSKINGLVASGNTAAFDGIWQGVNVTVAELGSKAVIAFTDGLENRSHLSPQPPNGVGNPATQPYTDDSTLICNFANGASIPVYTFNLGAITNTYYNTEAMEAFANGTGGFWRHAPSGALIDSVYDEIKVRICSRYKICYTSLDTIQDGTIHVTKICHKVGGNCVGCDEASCQEQAPPVIVRTPPTIDLSDTCQVRTNPLQICVKVKDADTPPASFTVRLFYRLVGSPGYPSYTDVGMTQQGGPNDSIFCYTIPANLLNCRSAFEYYITASDGQYTLSNPAVNPQSSPYSVAICANLPPTVSCIPDTSLFVCTLAQICLNGFEADDPDGNLATTTVSTGTILEDVVCFTPVVGPNVLRVIAVDSCGLADTCVTTVNVTLNSAPVVQCHADTTALICAPGQVCVGGFIATDVDNNIVSKTTSLGTLTGTTICFNAPTAGVYSLTFIATDACGRADTCVTSVTVILNQTPVADAGRDSTLFQCAPAPICITAACSDPNGNLSTCQLVSGPGTYNGSTICFTPAVSGTYTHVLKATDACGLTDYDTSVVNVTVNQAPIADAGRDSTLFQCTPAPICITASCSDPNGNLSTCQLVSGPGTYNGSTICFTPASAGTFTFVLKATDACGLTDYDTSVVNVTLNQAPVADAGRDSTLFQCTPAPICVTAACSDPNGNLSTCQLISGPGTYNGSAICFTPASAGTFTFVLKATDACGLTDYDTSVVNVTVNQAPVADAGRDSTLFLCAPAPICVMAACSDPNGNLSTCQLVSGPGTYNGSTICFTPAASGTYTHVLKATDACGLTDYDTSVVNVTINQAPVADAGRDSTLFQCAPAQICIAAGCSDPDANLTDCQLTSGPGTLNGGGICFTPAASGIYTFIVKATDACGLTDYDTSVVNVTVNQAPVADAGRDSTLFQCAPAPICITAACSDPNGNLSTCQLVSGPGTYNGSAICFTPASAGTFTFVLKATDACGLTDFDTSVVNVTFNQAPVADAGRDSTLFLCTPAPICITAACSDPNGNLSTCQLVSGPGTHNGSQICFTPAGAGTFTFVLKATDACGATDFDTSVVTVMVNSAPVVTCPGNQVMFVCNLNPICIAGYSATDAENNITTYQVTGGTIQGSQLCFTPVAGPNMIRVIAIDACGLADTCLTTVTVTLNTPPVANAGADQNQSCRTSGEAICWNVSCTDVDAGTPTCELVSPVGTLTGNQICFTPTAPGTYSFVLKATDGCGAIDLDTAIVTVRFNAGPEVSIVAGDTTFACLNVPPVPWCVPFSYSDPNNNVSSVSVSGLAGAVLDYANGSGTVCFTPPAVTAQYGFTLTVTDSCGLTAQQQHQHLVVMVDCDTTTCYVMQIEKTHNSLQGQYEFVSIFTQSDALEMGGFDLLIKYDNSGLNFVQAQPGQLLTSCGWEYFTYRYGAIGNCDGPCPSGLIRIIAVADANNGPNHPSCYGAADSGQHEVAILKFLVTNDRTYECQYLPITFYWIDCGDNAVSTVTGDTLYLDKRIYSFEGQLLWDELDNVLYPDISRPIGLGAKDYCLLGDKYYPIRCIEFIEGGVDIVCADSIDAPGDLNLNGIAYEIADAVLYTNYFLYGLAALDPNPTRREAQIAASDVNQDGTVLSVGDLVYLLRVIMGDALPFPKLAPFANAAGVKWQDGDLSISSTTDVGALHAKFRVRGSYQVVGTSGMEILSHEDNGEVSVLIYSGLDDMSRRLVAGTNQILHIEGDAELLEVAAADFEGNMLNVSISKASLPTEFALRQNRPNPFNPNTQIELDLPIASEWKIEIFNITGQLVKTLSGNGVGRIVAEWDGSGAPSGVYFYRANAGTFSETRKMLLLK